MRQIEVLAPAGSFETMKAAYKAGADAVYMGGPMFGARAYADNADMQQMLAAIDYAHLHGRKLYMTVNTLLKNTEIEKQLVDYIRPFYEQGLDAVIVQDLGVMMMIHTLFPDMAIHASTQMTVCGTSYGQWLRDHGASRIVTPRELSFAEIADMKQQTNVEIETFVHGALCYCYSGQCLMSSMIGGRSGNRGRCAQPCRLPWTFQAEQKSKSGYLLSPKDLCSLSLLPDLIEAGVDSLKIEGRMKKPEYAALTASLYRKYSDRYLTEGRAHYHVDQEDIEQLLDLYNRGGFTDGYFNRHNGREMMSIQRPNHSGLYVGQGQMNRSGQLDIHFERAVGRGDVIELPNEQSVKVDRDIPEDGRLRLKYAERINKNKCRIMRTRNESLIQAVSERYVQDNELKEKLYGYVSISKDLPARIELYHGEDHVSVEGCIVQSAQKRPLDKEEIIKRLMKTGGTAFEFEHLEIDLDEGCYMTVQELNQLRREALDQMEQVMLQPYRRQWHHNFEISEQPELSLNQKTGLSILVSDKLQAQVVADFPEVERIYLNYEGHYESVLEVSEIAHKAGKSFYLAMPYILRKDTENLCLAQKQILDRHVTDGFLVRNMETLLMLRSAGFDQPCISDYNMYCMNDRASQVYAQMMDQMTLPVELNKKELSGLSYAGACEMIVYGYQPLMVSAQCLLKTTGKCTGHPEYYELEDRKHKKFQVHNVCAFCYNLIYNSVPLYLIDVMNDLIKENGVAAMRLQFTHEDADSIRRIIKESISALHGKKITAAGDFTKGHYKRGVE